MSDDKETKTDVKEGAKPNPSASDQPKAGEDKTSDSKSQGNPNPDIAKLSEKIDTLSRQYNASTEEALKLKKVNEELAQRIEELTEEASQKPSQRIEDLDTFQAIVEKEGLPRAVEKLLLNKVAPLQAEIQAIRKEKADKIYDDFKAAHPGLKDEVLTRFDKEFSRLKGVYDNVEEAMEAAYTLINGSEADRVAKEAAAKDENIDSAKEQHKKEKQQVTEAVSEDTKETTPKKEDPNADLKKRIAKLQVVAARKERDGQDTSIEWAQIDMLQTELKRNL